MTGSRDYFALTPSSSTQRAGQVFVQLAFYPDFPRHLITNMSRRISTPGSSSRFGFRNSTRRTYPCPNELHLHHEGLDPNTKNVTQPNIFWRVLGFPDIKSSEVWRGAAAECMGMACYEFISVVSYVSSLEAGFDHPKLAASIVQVVVWGICILGTSLFSRQQQHLNSSFTFVTVLTAHISLTRASLYLASQCGGSLLGAYAARSVLEKPARTFMLGACVADGLSYRIGLLIEFFFTFTLIFVAFPIGLDYKRNPIQSEKDLMLVSFTVGGVVGLLEFISSGLRPRSPAGMNPARCLGVAVLGRNETGTTWNGHWIFWAGPLAAAAAFAIFYALALSNEQNVIEEPAPQVQGGHFNQDRRMDVVLNIKAIMHRSESERFELPLQV